MEQENHFFSLISGLVMTTSGKILLDENDITFKDISFRASKGIIYLPQEPSVLESYLLQITSKLPYKLSQKY